MLSDKQIFERRHVLYCDVLGFASYVQGENFEASRCFRLFHHLDELVHEAHTKIDPTSPDPITGIVPDYVIKPEATYCSDSIIISMPPTNVDAMWLCEAAVRLQNAICHIGFLVRGAIVTGDVYHSGNTIFGPAIARAVDDERQVIYPAIVISDETNKCFHASKTPEDSETVKVRSRQLISNYGLDRPFLDPFWLLKSHASQRTLHHDSQLQIASWRSRIEHGLANPVEKVRDKYVWAGKQFNYSLCNRASNIPPISIDGHIKPEVVNSTP